MHFLGALQIPDRGRELEEGDQTLLLGRVISTLGACLDWMVGVSQPPVQCVMIRVKS